MTVTEVRPIAVKAGMVDVATLKAAIAVCSNDSMSPPALSSVAFVLNHDHWELQACDSRVALWTGDTPADAGHCLVEGRALAKTLSALGVKPGQLVTMSFDGSTCTITARGGTFTLPQVPAEFPRLDRLVPISSNAVETMTFSPQVLGKITAVAKALGSTAMAFTFTDTLKAFRVRFIGSPDVYMIAMPVRGG